MQKWRVIRNTTYDGFMNMAIDEAIMKSYKEKKVDPTIRFYTWKPACVSIGYFQKMEEEIDIDTCKRLGIDFVRRTTGGRAVLHDDELTYSIVIDENNPLMNGGIMQTYRYISEGLANGLEMSGVKIDPLTRAHKDIKSDKSSVCFNSKSHYEISINNKKVVGSAQTRKEGIILQHGSIVLDFDVDKLISTIKIDESKKEKLKRITLKKASGIENELGIKIDIDILEENIIKALEKHFNIEIYEDELSDYEMKLATQLYEKYSNDDWNKKR
ncbi:lipoate--protein ligase family protein [Tepidibacter hydrothermalis]|uniref:Biotin/lipoate A/B protein ligase family protein n=1 Tax=Tepidibacter hydrothermalis TaxID=3036126 RepID=A0ABY8ED94_9FIRM|nr:biotin/lipoate A/B protein ligase family protein [Tepidibacter hydrothermalis]WFD09462.1 biotin/lipoate A/B protein ligase family protein [Tepidibacter hydrothermalis]